VGVGEELTAAAAAGAGGAVGVGVAEGSGCGPTAHDSPGEDLSRQLERYLRHMHMHTVVTAMCIVNTLTPRQIATLTVGE
jgi:hypothetical protein